jgi:hypothetical protein
MRWFALFIDFCVLTGVAQVPNSKQAPATGRPLEEWQRSWEKFEQHLEESRTIDGGGIEVLTNGSIGLVLALANGPEAPSELSAAAKRSGFGAEVEFTAVFKGIEATNDAQKKLYGPAVMLQFESPKGYFFSAQREAEIAKWKMVSPGTKVRWRARVSAVAVWLIRPDKPIYLVTLRDATVIE